MNANAAVGFAAVLVNRFDLLAQRPKPEGAGVGSRQDFPFFGSFGFWPFPPSVVPAFTHLEHPTHDFKIEFLAVLLDELEF